MLIFTPTLTLPHQGGGKYTELELLDLTGMVFETTDPKRKG
jgi:hypothetical protein